jgi:hypothetical protein
MRFVETPIFTRAVASLLLDEEYRQLQLALLTRPEQGALIRGSGRIAKTVQDDMTGPSFGFFGVWYRRSFGESQGVRHPCH